MAGCTRVSCLSVAWAYEDLRSHRCFICLIFGGDVRYAFFDNKRANLPLERLLGVSRKRLRVSSFKALLVFRIVMLLFGEGSHGGEHDRRARENTRRTGKGKAKESNRVLYKAGPITNWRHPF